MAENTDTDWRSLERFSFGDSPELADELAELLLAGKKQATCWAASEGPKTQVSQRWVVLDGSGVPVAVIETIELTQRRFDEVDAAFAFEEGEGDRTLASWRRAHRNYFGRQGTSRRICRSIANASGWSRTSVQKGRSSSHRGRRTDPKTGRLTDHSCWKESGRGRIVAGDGAR